MSETIWLKNLFFISLLSTGVGAMAFYLMAAERLQPPTAFAPKSDWQADIESVARAVDEAFSEEWADAEIEPTSLASNLAVARRLSLGLAGTIPSVEEIRVFESYPESEQLHWWVSRLLEDRRTSNHVAERLGRALVGVEAGPFLVFRRRRFVSWLSDEFFANRPYDQLVNQLLTDEGLWTDTPSVNFFTRTLDENENDLRPDPILLAGRTSRAFLGMRIDCLQCHDDFMGTINLGSADHLTGGTQRDFHALAAFFAEMENSLVGIRDASSRGPYEYKLLDEEEAEVIEAAVPFNQDLDRYEGNLRERLSAWVTHRGNRPVARAAVNRIWAIVTGRPLITPVDNIPLDGPFPAAMERLVDDFVDHDYDLHRLIRIIAATEVVRRESAADFEVSGQHEQHWAVYPMIRLRPDQVAGAIIQSTKLNTIDSTAHIITQLVKFGQQAEFVTRFGDPGEDEFKDRGETVTQRLLMLNGNMITERLNNDLDAPRYIAGLSPNAAKAVETVYLATLTRRPSDSERDKFVTEIEALSGNTRARAIVDLYWTLINSAEFRWNH